MANTHRTTEPHQNFAPLNERVGGGAAWLIGRLVIGGLFVESGSEKLMDLPRFAESLARHGFPDSIAPMLAPVAATTETLGGLCIALGFLTNWISLLMVAFVIIAAFTSHRFWEVHDATRSLQQAHFVKNMMIAGAFCLLYVAGGGPYSIDRWWRDRNAR